MFFPGSRYEKAPTVAITRDDGTIVLTVQPVARVQPDAVLFHARHVGQRLDHIAAHYLGDATVFWKLCDCANAMSPDALAAHDRIPVPSTET